MMEPYHKIKTVWERDPENNYRTLIVGAWARPEFEYLRGLRWLWTEKVDGTNIRVIWNPDQGSVEFRGKTDRADLNWPGLVPALESAFPPGRFATVFESSPTDMVCLYGEGYGPKIQSGGDYRDEPGFILFDVRVGDWWLRWEDVEDVGQKLGADVVPVVGRGRLINGIAMASKGFDSTISVRLRPAEGLVMRPEVPLRDRQGRRIITKVKCKDFQ